MSNLESFDEVHVISDLHMGGRPGFQILRETARLAELRRAGSQRSDPAGESRWCSTATSSTRWPRTCAGYVAIDDAEADRRAHHDDASFAPVWAALAGFVRTPRRTLVFVIGNHDIEIAFAAGAAAAASRGSPAPTWRRGRASSSRPRAPATPAVVGGARVYCIHGNEVDAWNYNRYEDLAQVSRRLNAGLPLDPAEWQPNAGTRMVKEVMNDGQAHATRGSTCSSPRPRRRSARCSCSTRRRRGR